MEIKLEKATKFVYKVFTSNGKNIGIFELDESGFYNYWGDKSLNGAWSAYQLRAIADKLDEINKPYSEAVDEYFKQEKIKDRNNDTKRIVELLNDNNIRF